MPGLMLAGLYAVYIFLVTTLWPAGRARACRRRRSATASRTASRGLRLARRADRCLRRGSAGALMRAHDLHAARDFVILDHGAGASPSPFVGARCSNWAAATRSTGRGFLSPLAQQVTFVMVPPLLLIFLVLGTIFIGVATPTEGGAMGAVGAMLLAARQALGSTATRAASTSRIVRSAAEATAKLSAFVMFILIGARIFSLTFYGVNGHLWVEHLLTSLPGGQVGFLIFVNMLVFLLAFFLDFFELAFIIVPLLGAGGREARHRPHLVRRHPRRQHADELHASAVRLRAVLPALGRARGALHRQGDGSARCRR